MQVHKYSNWDTLAFLTLDEQEQIRDEQIRDEQIRDEQIRAFKDGIIKYSGTILLLRMTD